MSLESQEIRKIILSTVESVCAAQLRAVRRLLGGDGKGSVLKHRGRSHIDMSYDILSQAGKSLHVLELISQIEKKFGVQVDRESLVSALTKRVARKDRFVRTDKNTFGLLKG